jgi:hypothetical protein
LDRYIAALQNNDNEVQYKKGLEVADFEAYDLHLRNEAYLDLHLPSLLVLQDER